MKEKCPPCPDHALCYTRPMNAPREFVADLHIHSRYAYACSKNLTFSNLASAARTKGIDLLATGDFTHPAWLSELEAGLREVDYGTFEHGGINFVAGTEVSCVFKQGGRSRRIHILLFLPSFASVKRLNNELLKRGSKLESDGRPAVKMPAADLTALAMEIDPEAVVIPAHIWTPWYGMFGSKSGFDSLEECFGDMATEVRAVETGLSSDPSMNWGIPELAGRAIVSFSDAHSLPNLGRESTVFMGQPTYAGLRDAIRDNAIAYTVEFHPEEGKYHYDGHRNCGVCRSPQDVGSEGDVACPSCGRPLTLGVLNRVLSLSGRAGDGRNRGPGPDGFIRPDDGRPPFLRLVPLEELLSEALGVGRRSKAVQRVYQELCVELGGELEVLFKAGGADLRQAAGDRVAEAVLRARTGEVSVEPGYDGQYGRVRVWPAERTTGNESIPSDCAGAGQSCR